MTTKDTKYKKDEMDRLVLYETFFRLLRVFRGLFKTGS